MKKINAKCLSFKELSYTATGYIMPCCWVDTPIALIEPQIARLRKEHLKLENNENIEDIINIKDWKEFFEELKTDPAILCQKFCSVPLHHSINRARENPHDKYSLTEDRKTNIKIYCVYFEGKYSPDYIEKLYNGLKKYCYLHHGNNLVFILVN